MEFPTFHIFIAQLPLLSLWTMSFGVIIVLRSPKTTTIGSCRFRTLKWWRHRNAPSTTKEAAVVQ